MLRIAFGLLDVVEYASWVLSCIEVSPPGPIATSPLRQVARPQRLVRPGTSLAGAPLRPYCVAYAISENFKFLKFN